MHLLSRLFWLPESSARMQLVYKGSVNRWECDENDHMNVRFYSRKLSETLFGGVRELGISSGLGFDDVIGSLTSQHIRYLKEARVATPLEGYAAVIEDNQLLTEIRESSSGEVLCASVNTLRGFEMKASHELPPYAGPRGLTDTDLRFSGIHLQGAKDLGFRTIGKGVIHQDECMKNGRLQLFHYMGRFSDSMPNLWGVLYPEATSETQGGAVVEYRMDYGSPLRVGDRYELVSGFRGAGAKTIHFVHLLFNSDSQQCCVSGESIGMRMDLVHRKAIEIAPSLRKTLEQLAIRSKTN